MRMPSVAIGILIIVLLPSCIRWVHPDFYAIKCISFELTIRVFLFSNIYTLNQIIQVVVALKNGRVKIKQN